MEVCDPNDPRQDTWTPTHTEHGNHYMACLSENSNICGELDANNKVVLLQKNKTDPSQWWTRRGKQHINDKTGKSMCLHAVMSSSPPEVAMTKCDPSKKHQVNLSKPHDSLVL